MRYFCISGFIISQNTKTSDNRLIERLLVFSPTFPTKLGKTERAKVGEKNADYAVKKYRSLGLRKRYFDAKKLNYLVFFDKRENVTHRNKARGEDG